MKPDLDPESLQRLAKALSPGATIAGVEDLAGGLDAAMSAFELQVNDGSRRSLVLRRYPSRDWDRAALIASRAWRTLSALEDLRFPAPQPVWLDEAGEVFGCPALVMTRVAGRTVLDPVDLTSWTAALARALAQLHSLSIERDAFRFLPGPGESLSSILRQSASLDERLKAHPDAPRVAEVLRRWRPHAQRWTPALVHGDFWPGNTVWAEGKVTAIVDWDSAALDQPGLDVGYCRLDLAMLIGDPAPALFLEAYQRTIGDPVEQLARWDLLAAFRALPDPARWLPGYHGLGRRDVTTEDMRSRMGAFIEQALTRATAAS
jgi:aminoglycoside phosphotransferase (APT) family kinase protein